MSGTTDTGDPIPTEHLKLVVTQVEWSNGHPVRLFVGGPWHGTTRVLPASEWRVVVTELAQIEYGPDVGAYPVMNGRPREHWYRRTEWLGELGADGEQLAHPAIMLVEGELLDNDTGRIAALYVDALMRVMLAQGART